MAYKITGDCVSCGSCLLECENGAISTVDEFFMIDPDRCTECVGYFDSPVCAGICSVNACVPDPVHKESKDQLLKKWHRLHPGETPEWTP